MLAFDHGLGLMFASGAVAADIEFVGVVLLQSDMDAPLGDIAPTLLHRLAMAVAQHLQSILGAPDEGTQGHGYGQAYHPRAGDAHAHGVFQDIGTQAQLDMFGQNAQCLTCPRHTQRHGHRLSTSDGWHHLLTNQPDDGLGLSS